MDNNAKLSWLDAQYVIDNLDMIFEFMAWNLDHFDDNQLLELAVMTDVINDVFRMELEKRTGKEFHEI